MSILSRRQRETSAPTAAPPIDPLACGAAGCPMPGSMSTGAGFLCSCHFVAATHLWPSITAALVAHDWHRELQAVLRRPEHAGDWRRVAATARPDLAPAEGEDLPRYLYRLHLDLQWRVGARSRRPGPMLQQALQADFRPSRGVSPSGNVARLLGHSDASGGV